MYEHLQHLMPAPEIQFYSIGTLCQQLQILPPQLLTLADEAGVQPHEWRDGCPIFRGDGVEKLCEHVNAARAALANAESKAAASPSN